MTCRELVLAKNEVFSFLNRRLMEILGLNGFADLPNALKVG